jgi:hypothetical protein
MTIIYNPAQGIDRRDEMTPTREYWHSYIYDFAVMRNVLIEIIEMAKPHRSGD